MACETSSHIFESIIFLTLSLQLFSLNKRSMAPTMTMMLNWPASQPRVKTLMTIWKIYSLMKYPRTEMQLRMTKKKGIEQSNSMLRWRDHWRDVNTVWTQRIC